ncbi:hypothetical protein F5888DRAFT_768512 [Russula emetica]|nr:hypothetical protein F5888DRAFT_768512 [Russula emetica]
MLVTAFGMVVLVIVVTERGLRTLCFVLFLLTLDITLDTTVNNHILLILPKTNHFHLLRGLLYVQNKVQNDFNACFIDFKLRLLKSNRQPFTFLAMYFLRFTRLA